MKKPTINIVARIVTQNLAKCVGRESFMNQLEIDFLKRVTGKAPDELNLVERNQLHSLAVRIEAVAPIDKKRMKDLTAMRRSVGLLEFA